LKKGSVRNPPPARDEDGARREESIDNVKAFAYSPYAVAKAVDFKVTAADR
jgi:hypothetical protein